MGKDGISAHNSLLSLVNALFPLPREQTIVLRPSGSSGWPLDPVAHWIVRAPAHSALRAGDLHGHGPRHDGPLGLTMMGGASYLLCVPRHAARFMTLKYWDHTLRQNI